MHVLRTLGNNCNQFLTYWQIIMLLAAVTRRACGGKGTNVNPHTFRQHSTRWPWWSLAHTVMCTFTGTTHSLNISRPLTLHAPLDTAWNFVSETDLKHDKVRFLGRSLMIVPRKKSWHPERVSSVVSHSACSLCLSVLRLSVCLWTGYMSHLLT